MCYLYCMPYSIDIVSLMLSFDDYHDNPLSFIQLMRIRFIVMIYVMLLWVQLLFGYHIGGFAWPTRVHHPHVDSGTLGWHCGYYY